MRKVAVVVMVLLVTFLYIQILGCVKKNTDEVLALPDYASWNKAGAEIPITLNGQVVNLLAEAYSNTDMTKLQRDAVHVLYDVNKNPWLAFYSLELGERLGNSIATKESKYYLYEKKDGKWVLVQDFSKDPDQVVFDFLENKYSLKLK